MDWIDLQMVVPVEELERATAAAQMVTPYGIYIEDYSNVEKEVEQIAHINLIDENLLQRSRETARIHIYFSPAQKPQEAVVFLEEQLHRVGISYQIEQEELQQEDWESAWQRYYHPIWVLAHLVVCPAWESCSLQEGDQELRLNPGMAFGTGMHETTRLCMKLLEEVIKPGDQMLDVGCGSGILSLTALLLGARNATAVDLDEAAVRSARENATLNQLETRVDFLCGDLVEKVTGKYDVICANIAVDVLLQLTRDIHCFIKPHTRLIYSGILRNREADVCNVIQKEGFIVQERREENDWVALCLMSRAMEET